MNKKTSNNIEEMLRNKFMIKRIDEDQKKIEKDSRYTNFSSLGGISYLIQVVQNLIHDPLFKKEEYENIGIDPPTSLLLYGVSGVGKSFIINCISHELKVPIIRGDMSSEKEIRESFRKGDLNKRSIIFFDDIDRLTNDDNKNTLYQLSEFLNSYRGNSIIIATASNVMDIDPSIRKFDNEILIRIPKHNERIEIMKQMMTNIKYTEIEWDEISRITPGYVPRDIKRLIKMAANNAIQQSRDHIITDDFHEAIKFFKKTNYEITFDNIGGLESIKEELKISIVLPSRYPDKFSRFGILRPSGVLLYGPPGCGKTLLARAVSNMSHCNFLSVKGPELITKYVGDSEKEIRKLFDKAKQLQPCVIFFDEIDSLCSQRTSNEFGNRIVNQILTLLDGLDDRGEVYVIGATNRLEVIDKAIMRPGRFDKIVEVPLPKKEECIDIFKKITAHMPMETVDIAGFDFEGLSGADISGVVKEAAIICLKDNFCDDNVKISKENILMALDKIRRMKSGKNHN